MVSPDGHLVGGWVTGASVLRPLARQIAGGQADTMRAQAAADWDHDDAQAIRRDPPAPLRGYQVAEILITGIPGARHGL